MTSIFIVGISSFMLWLNPNVEIEKTVEPILKTNQFSTKIHQIANTGKDAKIVEIQTKQSIHSNNQTVYEIEETDKNKVAENIPDSILEINYDLISSNKNSETFWPEDTVIDGEKFIITLTDKELENIGFELDGTGIYYKNKWNGNTTCLDASSETVFILPYESPRNKKEGFSYNDFYPVQLSTMQYMPRMVSKDEFKSQNDTLLPILIKSNQLKHGYDDYIFWFKVSEGLFKNLPSRYNNIYSDYQKIISNKQQFENSDIVHYKAKNITEGLKFIELSQNELHKLGVNVETERITFLLCSDSSCVKFFLTIDGVGGEIYEENSMKNTGMELIYLSNEYGEQPIKWRKMTDPEDKNSLINFIDKSQYLIPIILKSTDYPKILTENKILWFEPSKALFDSLPKSIGKQLRMEYNYISAKTDEQRKELTTNCTYFEACKSTLKVENCRLFPNPARTSATIEFSLPETVSGTISLTNISGAQIKTLVPTTSFPKGNNLYKFDLSGLSPGIYLVLIKTDKGFKTLRLIVSR